MPRYLKSSLRLSATLLAVFSTACGIAQTADKSHSSLPTLSSAQMTVANRVLTGKIACEFDQSVEITPLPERSGYFRVAYKDHTYSMAPEATTTGAVRLEDKKAGAVWIQIGSKSMLMNSKIGQRMVDKCVHPSQKT